MSFGERLKRLQPSGLCIPTLLVSDLHFGGAVTSAGLGSRDNGRLPDVAPSCHRGNAQNTAQFNMR